MADSESAPSSPALAPLSPVSSSIRNLCPISQFLYNLFGLEFCFAEFVGDFSRFDLGSYFSDCSDDDLKGFFETLFGGFADLDLKKFDFFETAFVPSDLAFAATRFLFFGEVVFALLCRWALDKAKLTEMDLSVVAVTIGPGLSLCLRVENVKLPTQLDGMCMAEYLPAVEDILKAQATSFYNTSFLIAPSNVRYFAGRPRFLLPQSLETDLMSPDLETVEK
ncbi:hypothetical protein Scep_012911 [Stephania cephalantha]|uniref:Uncharacterized protein n=1 Tax=Stephania cephalantha TaxID=152367 RepID=A0AAP0JHU2_9MAGN